MIRRITLENFMSHAHTVIEPAEGLTVLVGPNNCGKSAVVEALRTVCENDNADHLIRHGEKSCRIVLETDDGHTIAWCRKSSGTVWYEFDGEPQHRVGGKVPDKVHALLRLPRVVTPHNDTIDVHFGQQKEPIFLLAEEAADRKAAAFFSSTSDAEKLLEMQQLHREKRRNARARQKDFSADLTRADRVLASLAPLAELEPKLSAVELLYREIQEESRLIRQMEGAIERLDQARAWQIHEGMQCDLLRTLAAAPEQGDTAALERRITRMSGEQKTASRAKEQIGALKPLSPVPAISDTAPLERAVRELDSAKSRRKRHDRERAALAALLPPPEQADVDALVAFGKRLRAAAGEFERWQQANRIAAALGEPPALVDLSMIQNHLERWDAARKLAAAQTIELSQVEDDLRAIEAEAQAWAMQNPTCPLCGGVVDANRVLSPEHQHA